MPEGLGEGAEGAIQFCLDGIHKSEIAVMGGWNYSRPAGSDKPNPPVAVHDGADAAGASLWPRRPGTRSMRRWSSEGSIPSSGARGPAGGIDYSSPDPGKAANNPVPGAGRADAGEQRRRCNHVGAGRACRIFEARSTRSSCTGSG